MSNNAQKAEALRELADIIESAELPARYCDDQPVRILFIYPDAATRDQAMSVLESRGYSLHSWGLGGDFSAKLGAEGEYFPGVEFAMVSARKSRHGNADA